MRESPEELQSRLTRMEWVIRGFAAVISLALGWRVLSASLFIPKAEKIFADMLGSTDRLPAVTRAIIDINRLGEPLPLFTVGAFVIGLIGMVIAFFLPRTWAIVAFCFTSVVLLGGAALVNLALKSPLVTIIQDLNGF